jgi:hypothetical protein
MYANVSYDAPPVEVNIEVTVLGEGKSFASEPEYLYNEGTRYRELKICCRRWDDPCLSKKQK